MLETQVHIKKSGFLLILMALLFFMACLSTANTSHAAATLYVNGTSGNDTYDGTSPTWLGGTVGPKKTIQNASNAVDASGTVNVASGTYNEHINLEKSLSIIGADPSSTIIDGTSSGRVVYIADTINVILANFTIRNGVSPGYYNGGGIYNYQGNLTIYNCFINACDAPSGGAIFNNEGTLTIANSTLTNNNATNGYGGAICNYYSALTIINSTLTGNKAVSDVYGGGGAIYNEISTITITNSTLTENSATYYGGALYNCGSISVVTMNFNRVSGNSPQDIYTTRDIAAENNWWGSNSNPASQFAGTGTVNYSPWIYMTLTANPTLILNGTTTTLTASLNNQYDGTTITAINPANGQIPDGSPVTFNTDIGNVGSKTTTKNTSNGFATATLTANEGIGTAHITAQLDNQTVTTTVGIETLYVNGATGNDTWDGTSPTYISGTTGPLRTIQTAVNAINSGGTINVASATYNEHISIGKSLELNGTNPINTIIDGAGGQILDINSYVTIINFTIRNGSSELGAINNRGMLLISDSIISGNTGDMGAIYNSGTLNIINSTLIGNTARLGGAIFNCNYGGLRTVNIINSTLTENTATETGGAIYNYDGTLIITNSTISDNTGSVAIYCNAHGTITITNSTLSGNTGCAIHTYDGTVTLTNSTLTNNDCAISNCGTVDIINSTLSDNTANIGGAIYNYHGSAFATLNIINSTISRNTATANGGAIFNTYGSTVTIINSTLSDNTATGYIGYGGAIFNSGGTLTILDSTLTGNIATEDGGAIYNTNSGIVTMHFNHVFNNSASVISTSSAINATNNWWGTNSDPSSQLQAIVNYSPWLYMTLTASPTLILEGATSTLTASFNNAYDGTTVTAINPAGGHLPDGGLVTFTTNLGNVGSKITTKNTSNGLAVAILTADEGNGTANITAQFDSQILNTIVEITYLYVNDATGDDDWDGLSPIYLGGKRGPMKTINNAIKAVNVGGTIIVASGTYIENLVLEMDVNLIGNDTNTTIISTSDPNINVIVIEKGVKALISGFTIQDATNAIGVLINGAGVEVKNNNIFNNNNGIVIETYAEKCIVSSNNIKYNNIGIYAVSDRFTANFNSILENNVDILAEIEGIDATYNWWGQNEAPSIIGVITSPCLYLTLTAVPSEILDGQTSQIIASFNNAYDGYAVNPIDPADGHIQDNSPVTFTTDLGNVGSKTTIKNTINGTATATLSADETPGTAHITTFFDKQEIYANVIIIPARFVDGVNGNDLWDGSSPVWVSGLVGPMKTIQTAINAIESSGVVSVAAATYTENILVNKLLTLKASENGAIIQPSTTGNAVIIVNSGGSGSTIQGFIINGSSNSEIYVDSASGINIINNTVNGTSGSDKSLWGICLVTTNGNNIINNTVTNCEEGINLYSVQNTIISGNTVKDNHWDNIALNLSFLNIITQNTISNADSGIRLIGGSNYNNLTQNNLSANVWTSISLMSSYYNQITSNLLSNNQAGTYLYDSHNNTLRGNVVQNNIWDGIALHDSSYNTVNAHAMISGNNDGVFMVGSSNHNTISNNNFVANIWAGIALNTATANTITGNNLTGAHVGIYLTGSNQNVISQNNITGNDWDGIDVLYGSNQNIITHNNITSSYYGERILDSSNNTSYMNNYVGNTVQAYDNSTPTAINYWDNSLVGNYWSDWPYTSIRSIDGGVSVDRYPSLTPL